MNENIHNRAGKLILESRIQFIPEEQRNWLVAHLEICPACAARAAGTERAVSSLRLAHVALDPVVVEITRRRVRFRAQQLQPRHMPSLGLWLACAASWLWIALSAPWLWRWFAWAAGKMNIPSPFWQMGYALWWAVPALIAAGALSMRSLQDADAGQAADGAFRNS